MSFDNAETARTLINHFLCFVSATVFILLFILAGLVPLSALIFIAKQTVFPAQA